MEFTPVSKGPTHCFVGVKNVLVSVYVGTPDVKALHERVPWIESSIEQYGGGGLLVVIDPRGGGILPDRKFRDVSREQTERFAGHILFSATVIEGAGLQQTLIRTFLRSLAAVAGPDIPVRFFDLVAPATHWVEALAKSRGGPSAEELQRAVAMLRP